MFGKLWRWLWGVTPTQAILWDICHNPHDWDAVRRPDAPHWEYHQLRHRVSGVVISASGEIEHPYKISLNDYRGVQWAFAAWAASQIQLAAPFAEMTEAKKAELEAELSAAKLREIMCGPSSPRDQPPTPECPPRVRKS